MNNSYGRDRIALSEAMFADLKRAKAQNYELIYGREGLSQDAGNVVEEMFERLYERLLADLKAGDESSPAVRHHVDYLAAKSSSIDRDEYLRTEPNQIVVDYIASMTDRYFTALYAHLFPDDSRRPIERGYCADLG